VRRESPQLAREVEGGSLQVVTGDFYAEDIAGPFGVVCYFDGFGIGTDADHQRLLQRIQRWLSPGGCALIDVFAPWYWAGRAGTIEEFPTGSGVYYEDGFDAHGCRMIERMWKDSDEDRSVNQSLRCYSPADLSLLLEKTGLALRTIEPYTDETYGRAAPLVDAMLYLACIERRP